MTADLAVNTAAQLLKSREPEQERLDNIAAYVSGNHSSVYVPKGSQREYTWIHERSTVNVLPLIISVISQNLYVDGFRPDNVDDKNSEAWKFWQKNKMDSGQHGIHRAALKYGISYALVLPAFDPVTGEPCPKITPMSPRRMTAFYADFNNDEWPLFAIDEIKEKYKKEDGSLGWRKKVRLFDDEAIYNFTSVGNENIELVLDENGIQLHDAGVCPVVRFLNEIDLDEDQAVAGEIEPLITIQDQINSTTFNLLMAQQYSAFRQRYATGMVIEDEQGRPVRPPNAGVDRLLTSDSPDTKFGEFGQTDLSGYLKSREESIRIMSTISQFPPAYLLGSMVNISAEGMVAARDGLDSKVKERKSSFGESYEQMFRLCGKLVGDMDMWQDESAQVIWRDTSPHSLAAVVDALGKMKEMLEVPPEVLYPMIPGVTKTDADRWIEIRHESDVLRGIRDSVDNLALPSGVEEPEEVT